MHSERRSTPNSRSSLREPTLPVSFAEPHTETGLLIEGLILLYLFGLHLEDLGNLLTKWSAR
jgi:hypothetical protein